MLQIELTRRVWRRRGKGNDFTRTDIAPAM